MHNYLDDPVPDDPILRIHHFARDLAYGAVMKYWSTSDPYNGVRRNNTANKKWSSGNHLPDAPLLKAYGYIERDPQGTIELTHKAFDLLNQPIPASIFISYSRKDSSAFALLILSRFKALGMEPFLDLKSIKPGDNWHDLLKEEVQKRDYFVCLMGEHTLESEYVCKEIQWAIEANRRTIPIWHNGFHFQPEAHHPDWLVEFMQCNAIIVDQEDTKAYEGALIELFNYFGFTPA